MNGFVVLPPLNPLLQLHDVIVCKCRSRLHSHSVECDWNELSSLSATDWLPNCPTVESTVCAEYLPFCSAVDGINYIPFTRFGRQIVDSLNDWSGCWIRLLNAVLHAVDCCSTICMSNGNSVAADSHGRLQRALSECLQRLIDVQHLHLNCVLQANFHSRKIDGRTPGWW